MASIIRSLRQYEIEANTISVTADEIEKLFEFTKEDKQMLASDGLPKQYYNVVWDKEEIKEMKRSVFKVLDMIHSDYVNFPDERPVSDYTVDDIRERADINGMFMDQVTDFVTEWKELNKKTQ